MLGLHVRRTEKTYIPPTARIMATEILVRMFIWRFHTKKTGMIASVQSAAQEMAEYTYVALTMMLGLMHFPSLPVKRVQKYAEGLHWKMKSRKKKAPYS